MKVAAVQMSAVPGDVAGNLAAIKARVRAGAESGCRLLLFPEISDLGYEMDAIATHGRTSWPLVRDALSDLAREHALALVCGVCLPGPDGLSNALAAFGPDGGVLALYRKIHLFSDPQNDERRVFRAGNDIVSFDLDGIRFGLSICYDLRFPELFRVQALRGCQALLVAAAWPRARASVWQTLCMARAVENQCQLLGANRVGTREAFPFAGNSVLAGPKGDVLTAGAEDENLLCGMIDTALIAEARRHIPALDDRRPDLYGAVAGPLSSSL